MVRVLFTCNAAYGHFHPLVPIARAMAAGGHEVAFATGAALAPAVGYTGFRHFPVGLDWDLERRFPAVRTLTGPDRLAFVYREYFAGARPRQMIPELLALAATWPPDLLVRDEREYGGCIAAERLGCPHAAVGVNASGDFVSRALIAGPLAAHRAAHGLAPDPDLTMLDRYLTLRPFPRGFQDPALPVAPTVHYLRPTPEDRSGPEGLPPWPGTNADRPAVYIGLGTLHTPPAIFRAFIEGLRDEALTVIVTVGRDQDPADYGPQPDNVRIERYIPLSLLLGSCALAVTNGGSGTLMAALSHGLPVVTTPISGDQPWNAARCVALGLGRTLAPAGLTPERARAAVLDVLGDPACRRNAERMRDEIAAMPGPEYAVALLERLAIDRRPLPAG